MNSNDEIRLVNRKNDSDPNTIYSHDEPWPSSGIKVNWVVLRQRLLDLLRSKLNRSHSVLGMTGELHPLERFRKLELAPAN